MDRIGPCRLESERLVLEPLGAEHAAELAPVLGDTTLHQFTGGQPDNPEQMRARFERQAAGRSPDGREDWLNWVVRLRSSGQAVGTMQATVDSSEREPVAYLAWVIGASYQGQGFAKESAALVVSWLRARGVSCLRARIRPDHRASMGVAHAAGLRPTDDIEDGEVRWES